MSTDEQAERKHSLAYQEYKLRRHCLHNGIEVVGFYKEDHSAKSFDRPAFSKMLEFLRKNKGAANTLLFMMWDRFSRNTSEAYAMISMRSKLGVEPQALEQQLNLEVPKQKIMLALYRTTPEAENDRRSMNIHAGLRRAKKEGRYMGPLPAGYRSSRNEKNKPCLVPGEHADLVRESFEKMATWSVSHWAVAPGNAQARTASFAQRFLGHAAQQCVHWQDHSPRLQGRRRNDGGWQPRATRHG